MHKELDTNIETKLKALEDFYEIEGAAGYCYWYFAQQGYSSSGAKAENHPCEREPRGKVPARTDLKTSGKPVTTNTPLRIYVAGDQDTSMGFSKPTRSLGKDLGYISNPTIHSFIKVGNESTETDVDEDEDTVALRSGDRVAIKTEKT